MDFIRTEIKDRIATVVFDRPPVNALSGQAFREIAETFQALTRSQEATVVVLTSASDRVFCGGVDLNDSARRHSRQLADGDTAVDLLDPGAVVRECFWSVYDCPLPVIAAVNGAAVGAGVALVACCDIIVASERARFAVTEINAGVLGGGRHLQRLVGPWKTRTMFYTGEFVSAEEFYRLGAIERIVPQEQLMDAAMEIATTIASKSPIGIRLGKESLNRVEDLPLKDGYRLEQDYTGRVTRFNDSAEARQAFLEKRDPLWSWS